LSKDYTQRSRTNIGVSGLCAGALGILLLLGGCRPTDRPYQVSGESMLPSLHPGDRIFVDEAVQARTDLHDGDIIVLRRDDGVVLKRIMAMPGETISGDHRKVFRNGKQLDEPYIVPATGDDVAGLATFSARTVASGELFVMGDNRDISFDSRVTEYVPVLTSDVVGKFKWTYWHASSAGKEK
jgi:signal peptidase I